MVKIRKTAIVVTILLAILVNALQLADARRWTIYQRQVKLAREIDQGQRSGDLTLKEADNLRHEQAKINSRIAEMKAKNGGKISYEDQNKLEKMLNQLSVSIKKKKLAKRVQ